MKLDRTRVIFLAILGLTGVVICGALALNIFNNANGTRHDHDGQPVRQWWPRPRARPASRRPTLTHRTRSWAQL